MSEIKTAAAWGHERSPSALLHHAGQRRGKFTIPYTIVNRSEQDVIAGLSLLAKSREVCEWERGDDNDPDSNTEYRFRPIKWKNTDHGWIGWLHGEPNICPSCGRRVEIKEYPND